MANYNRSSLVLSVNRALWGEVTHSMRQVTARIERGTLSINVIFDEEAQEDERMATATIGSKAIVDFPELKVDVKAAGVAGPLAVEDGWSLIYRRKE